MKLIDNVILEKVLTYEILISALRQSFAAPDAVTPQRSHITYEGSPDKNTSTLLLMPSWVPHKNLGVKIATVSPANANHNLPSVNGVYLLFDAATGQCTHVFDAAIITAKRTAATSALASSYLSRQNSEIMLMVGTGTLAPELIKAHASVRPIKKVLVWGRDYRKTEKVCKETYSPGISLEPVRDIKSACATADIISCATLSQTPLLSGIFIREGCHVDLVGSYLPTAREADDSLIKKAKIYIDHDGAMRESGDLRIPLENNQIEASNILADLHQLCAGLKQGRAHEFQITLFKSVGHAMEDLVAAQLIAKTL